MIADAEIMNTDYNPCSSSELNIREAFKKEYKLSCPVLDDTDIFNKSLMILNLREKWQEYLKLAKKISDLGLGDLGSYRSKIISHVVNAIEEVRGFDQLENLIDHSIDVGKWSGPRSYLAESNIGKRMISIDLRQANYQSLKKLGNKFVLNTNNYEELISRYTKEKVLIESRMLRQLIFGLLQPKVQARIQRQIMTEIIDCVKNDHQLADLEIVHLTNDEVVFVINGDSELKFIHDSLKDCPYLYRITDFTIEKVINGRREPWFLKKVMGEEEKDRIMGVHVKFLFQVYNHLHGIENGKKDFWWRERGRLCALLDAEEFVKI